MTGLMMLQPTRQIVGKKSEYPTVELFALAVLEEECREIDLSNVCDCFMRYYPKGTEDSEFEFGKGEGVYQVVDKKSRGSFEVWLI